MSKSLKDIKRLIRKQLKKEYPNFSALGKKQKKDLLKRVCQEVYSHYDSKKEVTAPRDELLNIYPIPDNILTIEKMKQLIRQRRSKLNYRFPKKKTTAIWDQELRDIQEMVDWGLVGELLSPSAYTPGKREILPVQFFRAELLKHLKYPELSYRKYTKREINNPERRENRAFIGLGIHQSISHSQLSQYRSSLSFEQLVNIMVYFICLFLEKRPLSGSSFYAADSTELAAQVSPYPLFKLRIGDKYIRFYQDLDADVGTRRPKRDRSRYVVGYRLHTLTVIDAQREIAFPMLSVLAPANHHDSNFLELLVDFGKKIGLDINLVATDQAYGEAGETREINRKHNVTILSEPKERVHLPAHVNKEDFTVRMNSDCPIAMEYRGKDEEYGHEFHCSAQWGECPLEGSCGKIRFIQQDSGAFGQIPYFFEGVQRILGMRKVAERPFNLIKHRDGLEPLRTKGIQNSTVVAGIANIATLLIEIAGYRKKKKKAGNNQMVLSLSPHSRGAGSQSEKTAA